MNLNIFIAEDDRQYQKRIKTNIRDIAKEEGFMINEPIIVDSIDDTLCILKESQNNFDIIVLDIELMAKDGIKNEKIEPELLSEFLETDILAESKVIIYTGNKDFYQDPEKIRDTIAHGAKAIAIKAEKDGVLSFKYQVRKIILEIKNEAIIANIGRFAPDWKRRLFYKNKSLWEDLKKGKREDKIFLLVDISNSTAFYQRQNDKKIKEDRIIKLFHTFSTNSTKILDQDKYKGFIERYTGDGIFAYFDSGDNLTSRVFSVINAAEEIINTFSEDYKMLKEKYGYEDITNKKGEQLPVSLRVLIGIGSVLWIVQGTESHPQLSIMDSLVAKFHRSFQHEEKFNDSINIRSLLPGYIYLTEDVMLTLNEEDGVEDLDLSGELFCPKSEINYCYERKEQYLRNFSGHRVYKLTKTI